MLRKAGMFFVGVFLIGCANVPAPNETEEQEVVTRLVMVGNVSVEQAVEILEGVPAEVAEVRLRYPDHETIWGFDPADQDAINDFYDEEEEQLSFLLSNFDPNDPMEAEVYDQLFSDLENLGNPGVPTVRWVELDGRIEVSSPLFAEVQYVEASSINTSSEDMGRLHEAITDRTADPYYTPAGGTSTIFTTGTLQKFWLDERARDALRSAQDGLEINTLIYDRSDASCAWFGVRSSLPDYYRDTEDLDSFSSPEVRNCAVGSVTVNALEAWRLYWTWHPFGSFNARRNPFIVVQYQPSRWCSWIFTKFQCNRDRPYCMCSRGDMPIRSLISYNYNEAPGREVSWIKN